MTTFPLVKKASPSCGYGVFYTFIQETRYYEEFFEEIIRGFYSR